MRPGDQNPAHMPTLEIEIGPDSLEGTALITGPDGQLISRFFFY